MYMHMCAEGETIVLKLMFMYLITYSYVCNMFVLALNWVLFSLHQNFMSLVNLKFTNMRTIVYSLHMHAPCTTSSHYHCASVVCCGDGAKAFLARRVPGENTQKVLQVTRQSHMCNKTNRLLILWIAHIHVLATYMYGWPCSQCFWSRLLSLAQLSGAASNHKPGPELPYAPPLPNL